MEEKLVYYEGNKIFLKNPNEGGEGILIAKRTKKIKCLCLCGIRLFDATRKEIHDTITGELVAPRIPNYNQIKVEIKKLFSEKNKLFAVVNQEVIPSIDGDVGTFYSGNLFEILYNKFKIKHIEESNYDDYSYGWTDWNSGNSMMISPKVKGIEELLNKSK